MQHNVPPESATRHAKFVPIGMFSMCTRTRQGGLKRAVCPERTDRNNYQQEPPNDKPFAAETDWALRNGC